VAVLRHLHAAGGPQSHGEIADALAPQGLDRTTVYRNLTALTDKGLVLRRDLGDHVWRFELASPGDELHGDHPHFVCDRCGDVRCLAEAHVTISGPLDKNIEGSQIQEIVLKGTCGRCLTTEPATTGA
jgi:Fur family ferric uptake transcriptional regulator